MREALFVIAEIRDSERLRQFLSTGQDRMWALCHSDRVLLTTLLKLAISSLLPAQTYHQV